MTDSGIAGASRDTAICTDQPRYGYLGDSPIQAGIYVVTHPIQVLREEMLDDAGISYLAYCWEPSRSSASPAR